jgi:MraZ protein
MAEGFRGEHFPRLDSKARVTVPAQLRKVIEAGDPVFAPPGRSRFVIVYGDDRRSYCEAYTMKGMRRLERRIARLPEGSDEREMAVHELLTLSVEVEIDEDSRIVLPPACRRKLGLTAEGGETAMVGRLGTFRIYRREDYEEHDRARRKPAQALPAQADIVTLLPPDDEDEED